MARELIIIAQFVRVSFYIYNRPFFNFFPAVQVIENGITASHLNLTRSQFKSYLTGTKPPLALMEFQIQRDSKSALGGIFERNIETGEFSSPALQKIRNIKTENEKFFERARRLRKEMSEWSISVSKEVDEILTEYPLKLPTNTGEKDGENVPGPKLELSDGSTSEQASSVVSSPEDKKDDSSISEDSSSPSE